MKKFKIIIIVLALVLSLSACNTDEAKQAVDKAKQDVDSAMQVVETTRENIEKIAQMVKTLEELKVKYIGDNSKVMKLIENTGIKDMGSFKIELQTGKEPYGLKINFDENVKKEIDYNAIRNDAVKLLGLIENLGYVEITKDGETKKYTKDEISEQLGFDVKELYKNSEKLEEFIKDNYEKAK